MIRNLPILAFLVCLSFVCQAQKTYFITTERDTQQLVIDGQKWSGNAFFEVASGKKYVDVKIYEDGYKMEYDVLHKDTNHPFSTQHFINVDTNIIAIIKPIEINFIPEAFDFQTNSLDLATFLKDLDHDGALQQYAKMEKEDELINAIKPSVQYLTNELNEYHNSTIGRYKFYTLAEIKSIHVYEVFINENDTFIQVYLDVDWSITSKNTENLPQFPHPGKSGKFIVTADNKKDQINRAVNDALLDSIFYFLEEQEMRLIEALKF